MLRKHVQEINYSFQKASLNEEHKVTESLGQTYNFIPPNRLVPKSYVYIWKQKKFGRLNHQNSAHVPECLLLCDRYGAHAVLGYKETLVY